MLRTPLNAFISHVQKTSACHLQEDSWHEFTSKGPGQEGVRSGDWGFMKGCKVMEVAARRGIAPVTSAMHANQATLLYDVGADQKQLNPLADEKIESHMIRLLIDAMAANDSPLTQYARLGLPSPAEATDEAIAAACITTTEVGQAYREHNANGTPMGAFVTRSGSGKVHPDPIAPSMERHIRPGVLFGPEAATNRPKL